MPEDPFFHPELFAFLLQLKRHNSREWFAKNKARYQDLILEPALVFVASFAAPLFKISPHFVADPRPSRGSLFRIYRDIRFSSDKRPFKTHIGISFSHISGKNAHAPVFYLHLEPDSCFAAAGVWHPDAQALSKIRAAILDQPEDWKKVRRKLELEGDRLSRPPRGFDPNHQYIEDIKYKDFVTSVPLSEAEVCSPRFMPDFVKACRTMTPLVQFTTRALRLKF